MIKLLNFHYEWLDTWLLVYKKAGFDGIDLCLGEGVMGHGWQERIEHARRLLDKYEMVCAQVHLPWYDIFASSEIYDEEIESEIKNSFKAMELLGAKWGALHAQSATNFGYDRQRALHDNTEKIKGYLEEAVKYDRGIAVENLAVFPDCPQYKFFTAYPEELIELIDTVNSPLVQICWDFGHANLMEFDMSEALKKMGSRIKILHVHNNNKQTDFHVTPSIGTLKWDGVIDTLRETGFDGPMTLEVNMSLNQHENLGRYINYIGEDARWLEGKFEK